MKIFDGNFDFEIVRKDKGVRMLFFPKSVIKAYDLVPSVFSEEEHNAKFSNEIAAYQKFLSLQCEFVPILLEYSLDERWFRIDRIVGESLFDLSQSNKIILPFKSLMMQIRYMDDWLRNHEFCDTGNNIKDLVLGENGKLYLVDFEPYNAEKKCDDADIFNALIIDILDRLFIRRGRSAILSKQFMALSFMILAQKPLKSFKYLLVLISAELKKLKKGFLHQIKKYKIRFKWK